METIAFLHTNGKGYWSDVSTEVKVTGLELGYVNNEETFGELKVYFDQGTWLVSQNGLIYSDLEFIRGLKVLIKVLGFEGTLDLDYSEQGMQGMQGLNYVSFDIGPNLIKFMKDVENV